MKKAIYIFTYSIFSILLLLLANSFTNFSKAENQLDSCRAFLNNYGPYSHFVDSSSAGIDSMDNNHCCPPVAIISLRYPGTICVGNIVDSVKGANIVRRSNPINHRVETEVIQMTMIGDFMGDPITVSAGAGKGLNPILGGLLLPSFGAIVEGVNFDSSLANSFFDVFIEIQIIDVQNILPGNDTLYFYNQAPIHLSTIINSIPPKCGSDSAGVPYVIYSTPPLTCIGLFTDLRIGFGNQEGNLVGVDKGLPVELSSFSSIINSRDVILNWTTASEKNNSGFDVERSLAKGEWSKIGFVKGNGTSDIYNNYSFEDRNLNSGRYSYRLKQIDYNGNFNYYNLNNEAVIGIPDKFSLYQNYPNPFNPTTKINYDISRNGIVTLKLFDNSGREIRTLLNEFKSAGYYTYELDAKDLASGVYYYQLVSDGKFASKKMILLK